MEVGTPFPVVFSDGEREISMGNVVVSPSFSVKWFHSMLGEMIGISGSQVSVYLADRKGSRVPLTARVNIPALCREEPGVWFFLVVLKRSRRGGGQRRKVYEAGAPGPEMTLLRRDGNGVAIGGGYHPGRAQQLEMARERYLASMGLGLGPDRGGRGNWNCEECSKAGEVKEFHCCVNDAVAFGFRSQAGPVAPPPTKRSV